MSGSGEAAALSSIRLCKIPQSEKNRRILKIALQFPFFKVLSPPPFSLLQSSALYQSLLTFNIKVTYHFFPLSFYLGGVGEDLNIFLHCWIYFFQSEAGFEILSRVRSFVEIQQPSVY